MDPTRQLSKQMTEFRPPVEAMNRHRAYVGRKRLWHTYLSSVLGCQHFLGCWKLCFEGWVKTFLWVCFFWPEILKKNAHTLINFLSDSVKLAIWLTRQNRARNTNSVEPVPVLEGLLKAGMRVEHVCYKMTDNMVVFCEKWTIGRDLCCVGEHGEF